MGASSRLARLTAPILAEDFSSLHHFALSTSPVPLNLACNKEEAWDEMIAALLVLAAPAADPTAVVHQLLAGWREGNAAKAKATWAPQFRLLTLRQDGSGKRLDEDTPEHLSKSMAALKPGDWDVRLGKPVLQRDATGIATVWAPYTFYMKGKKSHCGVENFTLYRLNGGWKIVQFADTHLWNATEARCADRSPSRR